MPNRITLHTFTVKRCQELITFVLRQEAIIPQLYQFVTNLRARRTMGLKTLYDLYATYSIDVFVSHGLHDSFHGVKVGLELEEEYCKRHDR